MNIIEEFFLRFNTDAKQARADITDLDKKIEEFAAKGNKRTEDEKKQLDAMRKLRADRITDFKDLSHQTEGLAGSFTKLATAVGAGQLGADLLKKTFDTIKGVVVDAADYNFQLSKTASLTGINARELSIWDGAVQQAGGHAGEFLGYITALNMQYAALGVNDRIKYVTRDLLALSKAWDGLNAAQREQRAVQLGLSPGEILLLNQGYDKLVQILQTQRLYNNENDKTAALGQQIYETTTLIDKQWKAIGTDFEPILAFAKKLELAFASALRITLLLAEAIGRLAILQPDHAIKDLKEAWDVFWGTGQQLGGTGPYAKGAKAPASAVNVPPTGTGGPLGIRSNNPGNIQPGGREAVYGSLQEGVAAEESQLGRYGGRGINTLAGVAANWPDHANAATWLATVSKYSGYAPNQQLDLNDPQVQARIANAINVAENGPAFGNLVGTAQGNLSSANQSPLNSTTSSSNSLSVGSVVINTQATDASGIAKDFHGEMQKQYSQTINSYDDGVAY